MLHAEQYISSPLQQKSKKKREKDILTWISSGSEKVTRSCCIFITQQSVHCNSVNVLLALVRVERSPD